MAARGTASSRVGGFKVDRNDPVAEVAALLLDHSVIGAAVGRMTDCADPSFLMIDRMQVMKIPAAVAKTGLVGSFRRIQHGSVMAFEAERIRLRIECIRAGWIIFPKQAKKGRAVGSVTRGTLALGDRAVQMGLPFDFASDVTQRF